MDFLVDVISESEALRRCNLAATNRWRSFLREKLPHNETQGGKLYPEAAVDALAAKIGDFAAETMPHVESSDPKPAGRSSRPLTLKNRLG